MKNKRLFLVSLILLAVLIIGAASAADTPDLDESLAADNIEEVSADTSFETDVISEGNDEVISSSDEDMISDEVDDIVDYSDEDMISDEVDDIVDCSDEDMISDGADKVLGDSEEEIVAIIVDPSEHFYNGDDEFIWVHLPIGLTGGYVTVEDNSAMLIRAEFEESYWQEDEDGHYFCLFVPGDINWSDVGDGDTVTIKYVDEEEVIWNQSDYTVHFNGDLISFEEKNYGWDEFNPVISNEININDDDAVVEINTFYQGTFTVTVQDEYGREWSISRGVNMEDDDDGYVRLNLEDLWIEETGIYFLTGKFVHYSEGEDGDVEIVFENHRLRVISNFYTNEGLITYKEVVGLITDDRNLNTGRIVITDSYTGAVYFDKALADMKYNDSMMGYIYNEYHGYYVFAKDLENIGSGRHYITATYYNDDGSVNETSGATIFLDLDSCVNTDEVDFRDLDAVLLKVYIFEMYEDGYIVFGERKEDEDGGEEFVTYFKSEKITASDVGKVLTFTLEDLGFEEGFYCADLTIGDGLDDNSNYFYKLAFDKEIKIVDNSKFRIKMDDEVSLFNTDDVFFVYCPEDSADNIITIKVENGEHELVHSFYYHIIAEEAGGYIGLTLDELRVSNPGLYFFNILDFEEENELVEPFEYEFYNPLSTKDVCIVDDEEDNKIVELFVPEGFSEGSVIITDEDGIELFNKPLTQMEYYSEGYDGDFVRYYVTYDDLNIELDLNETYKLTASYVGSKNFEVEWDVLFVKKTIAEKDGVSIELFDHWAHDLNDEEDRIARVFSPYYSEFDISIGDWQRTFNLEPDEGGYCREIYVGDIDVGPGTYLVTVTFYDDEIFEEFLYLSAEMEFIFDNDDRSEIIIFIDEEVNYPTTGEDVDDGFVAISVPAELEGSVIISANDEEFFSKSFSDFARNKVGPEDDEELEDYLRYVVSPLDVNFFGGLDDGDEVEISVFDADENRLSSKTYRIFFEGDSFRFEAIDDEGEDSIVINEVEIFNNPDSEDYDPNAVVATITNDVNKVAISFLDSEEPFYEKVIGDEDWIEGHYYIHLSDVEEQFAQIKDKDVVVFTIFDDEGEVIDEPIACQVKVTDEYIQLFPGYEESTGMEFNVFYGNLTTGDLNNKDLMGWHPEGRFIEIIYPEQLEDFTVTFGDTTLTINDFIADYAYAFGGYSYTLMLDDIDLDLITENDYITFTLSAAGNTFTQKRIRLGEYVYKVATPVDVARLFDINIVDEILSDGSETAISFLATEDANPQSMLIDIGGGIFNVYVDGVKVENLGKILGFEGDELETFNVWDLRDILNVTLYDLGISEAGTYNIKITHTPYDDEENEYMHIVETELMNKDVTWFAKADPGLTITVEDISYGNDANIVIGTNNTFSGIVKVQIDGNTYDVNVNNGRGVLSISSLNVGTYTAKAIFEATDVFNAAEDNVTFIVEKAQATVNVPLYDTEYDDAEVLEITVAGVEGASVPTGEIGVLIVLSDGTIVKDLGPLDLVNGEYNTPIIGLAAGDYNITVTYAGDGNYNEATFKGNFKVNKIESAVSCDPITFDYGNSGTATATVDGATGVTAVIEGHADAIIAIEGLSITVSNLNAGNYDLIVTTIPDMNHTAKTISVPVTVKRINPNFVIAPIGSVEEGDPITISISADAGFVGDVTVSVGDNSATVHIVDGAGTGTLSSDGLAIGDYTVALVSGETENYNAGEASAAFTIVEKVVPKVDPALTISVEDIVYGEDATIVIGTNNTFSGIVKVQIGENEYMVQVNEGQGQYTVSNLGVGDYTAKAIFEATDIFNEAEATTSFNVNKADSYVSCDPISFAYGGSGSGTLTVEGATVSADNIAVVDHDEAVIIFENNVVTVSNLDAGSYALTITTTPDENHNAKTITVPVTVSRVDATVAVSDFSFDYGGSGVVTATVVGASGIEAAVDGSADYVVVDGYKITVSGLDVGTYTLSVTAVPDANHNAASATATVTVNKVDSEVSVGPISFDYGGSDTVTATVVGATGITATIDGSTDHVVVDGYKITVSGLDAGDYELTVTTIPDANHNAVSTTATVTVNKVDSEVSVGPISFDYGGSDTVTATVVGATGITAAIDGSTDHVTVNEFEITVSGLDAGEYELTVTTIPDANHNAKTITVPVTVNRINPNFVIAPIESVEEGNPITISISDDTGFVGDVTVSVGDNSATVHIADGVGTGTLYSDGLAIGDHTVALVSEETKNYNAGGASATVTITEKVVPPKVDPALTITVEDIVYGEDATIVIGTNNTFSGTVKVQIGENEFIVQVNEGQGQYTISNLGAGDYTAKAIFEATDVFDYAEATSAFVVEKAEATVDVTDVNFTYGGFGIPGVSVGDGVLKLNASVNSDKANVTVDLLSITITGLDAGTYTLTVTTVPDDNHKSVTKTSRVTVNKAGSYISCDDIVFEYGSSGTATVTFENATDFTASIDGSTDHVAVDGDVITVSGLDAGDYILTLSTVTDGNHKSVTETARVTVNKTGSSVSCDDIVFDYGGSGSGTLTVEGATVSVENVAVVGHDEAVIEVENNVVTVSNLDPGNYTLTVTAIGDKNHKDSTTTVKVTVNGVKERIATQIICTDMYTSPVNTTKDGRIGNYFVIKLLDAEGNILPGLPIKIGFNGQIYERNITSNGAAHLQINLKKEDVYTFAIYFAGDEDYLGSFAVAKITVSKTYPKPNKANQSAIGQPVTVNKTSTKIKTAIEYEDMVTTTVNKVDGRVGKYFTFTLKDTNGKPIAGKFIQIGFNGNIYNRTTGADGSAKLQINLKKVTVYTFAISFLEDDEYQGSFAVAKITVKPQTPKLTASSKSFKASTKTKKISATFKTAYGNAVAGIKVTFTVNGKTYSATTNDKGVAAVNVSLTKKGSYSAVAKFAGNTCFKATSTKFTVKIT